jgi:AraC-like DNA-binding protein
MDHLNGIRILQACSLLENTSKSITEISYACGFHSSAYFSDIFKKALGMSPRAYRKLKS